VTLLDAGVLVVGASSGIGRSFAIEAARVGARVAMAARRIELVEAAAAEARDQGTGGVHAFSCDVRLDDDCEELVRHAVDRLGRLDLVFHAAGSAPLRRLIETESDEWRAALDTNVVGLQRVVRSAVPVMADGGIVAVVSSETVGKPRAGLGAYAASKAALDESLRTWRIEHPEHRFACLTIGATQPTDFGSGFDMTQLAPAMQSWTRHGLMQEAYMDTTEVAAFMASMLGAALVRPTISVEQLTLRSPSPVASPREPPST
jgi:NAD(P)-dependent dehydrogenase (short-subunit alcohol dehydrogenase family)